MSPSVSARLLLTQSDARLIELAGDGHERAFEALVQRYRRPLLGYCRRLLLRDERAEDALQQGLLQAWLALQGGYVVHDAKSWLYRIVHNCALNALRVSGYDYNTLTDSLRGADAPEHDLDRRIAVRETLAGLAALPEMQREALMRTAIDGHSHEQVARALGLSEGALRGLVYRARVTLRAAATAITPAPAIGWALTPRTATSAPLVARLAEAGAGGGSVGLGGMLVKGGTIAITAGVLAGGITAIHHPSRHSHRSLPPSDGSSREVLLAANAPSDASARASRQAVDNRHSDRSNHGLTRDPASRIPRSIAFAPPGWRLRQPSPHRVNDNAHGEHQPAPLDSGAITQGSDNHGQGAGSLAGQSHNEGDRSTQGSDLSNGLGTSNDTSQGSDGGGDKTALTSETSSSGKDSTSSGSGSDGSQTQTSSGTGAETSVSGDSGSSSGDGTNASTAQGSTYRDPSTGTGSGSSG
ncbi:MAG: RNA polymerase sigma factor [Solirubrobacteraceae bacterium]